MIILSIDTSADETSVAITSGRKTIASVQFSQIPIHKNYGGIYPILAKREHQAKIVPVIDHTLRKARTEISQIDAFAVTFGPGLPPALEVGVQKAKELALTYKKPLIPVDHIEGHIYSAFVQNRNGNPAREMKFPCLALVISGGHTELVLMNDHIDYSIIGTTLDDAAGEALDKAARMLGFQYPGGPIIEQFALKGNIKAIPFPIPMLKSGTLDFSYSGIKTAFKYMLEKMSPEEKIAALPDLCATFQNSVFESIKQKFRKAILKYNPKIISVGGGVSSNVLLRKNLREIAKECNKSIYFPPYKYLNTDNAAMIGVAAFYKYEKGIYLTDPTKLDRIPRANLDSWIDA